jgi:ABC-type branched-subunit amino acid transport system substrate-binding protein
MEFDQMTKKNFLDKVELLLLIVSIGSPIGFYYFPSTATDGLFQKWNQKSSPYQIPAQLDLGGLFPLSGVLGPSGVQWEAVARMAVDQINNDTNILTNTTLNLIIRDTKTNSTIGRIVSQELRDLGVVGLVGAGASNVSIAVAEKGEYLNLPQISYASTNPVLSNKTFYPKFFRVLPSEFREAIAMAHILWSLNITTVSTIYETSQSWYKDQLANQVTTFENTFKSLGGTIATSQSFALSESDITPQLAELKTSGAKTILVNSFENGTRKIFSQVEIIDMTKNEGFQYVGLSFAAHDIHEDEMREKMQGMIGTDITNGNGPVFNDLLDLWETCNGQTSLNYTGCGNRKPDRHLIFAYDAVYAFAYALDNIIKTEKDPFNGEILAEELSNLQFHGSSGFVKFDENGDALSTIDIYSHNGSIFVDVGDWYNESAMTFTQPLSWSSNYDYYSNQVIIYSKITTSSINNFGYGLLESHEKSCLYQSPRSFVQKYPHEIIKLNDFTVPYNNLIPF